MKCVALLTALVAAIVQKSLAEGRIKWNVTVFTGGSLYAGTEDIVSFQIFGETNFTDYQELNSDGGGKLGSGSETFYQFTTADLGFPTYIRVYNDKHTKMEKNHWGRYISVTVRDNWNLNKIDMQSNQTDSKLIRYTFNSWLYEGLDNHAIIYGQVVDTEWSIRVTISNEREVMSEDPGWLKIYGPNGCTEPMALQNEEQEFKVNGATIEFKYVDIDVGNPTFIKVWVNIGAQEKWPLEKVELKKPGLDNWISYPFGGKWLGGGYWKNCEAIKYTDPAAFESKSSGKIQPAGLLLSAGLGLCLMVAQM